MRVPGFIMFMLLTMACAGPSVYNPGDPASEEFNVQFLLRCALFDPEVCPVSFQAAPDAATGLGLWLEADVLSQGDGTAVTSWTDQSAGGFNADQSIALEQPTFKTNTFNGHPAIRFDGTTNSPGNNLILGSNYLYSTNDGITILTLVRSNSEDNTLSFLMDFGTQAPAGYGVAFSANTDGVGTNVRLYTGTNAAVGGVAETASVQSAASEIVILSVVVKFAPAADKHQSVYRNGTIVMTNATHNVTQLTAAEICEGNLRGTNGPDLPAGATCNAGGNSGPVTIGGQSKQPNLAGRFFHGDMALMVWYDRALSEGERQSLECYAALKYGVTVSQHCL